MSVASLLRHQARGSAQPNPALVTGTDSMDIESQAQVLDPVPGVELREGIARIQNGGVVLMTLGSFIQEAGPHSSSIPRPEPEQPAPFTANLTVRVACGAE